MPCIPNYNTTNVADCFLQVKCNDKIMWEFYLPTTKIMDTENGFTLNCGNTTRRFLNTEIDITAQQVRDLRAACISALAAGSQDYEAGNYTLLCDSANQGISYLAYFTYNDGIKENHYITLPSGLDVIGNLPQTAVPCKDAKVITERWIVKGSPDAYFTKINCLLNGTVISSLWQDQNGIISNSRPSGAIPIEAVYKTTLDVYDQGLIGITGTITPLISGSTILFNASGLSFTGVSPSLILAVDFGDGSSDIGTTPSRNFINNPAADYEAKVYSRITVDGEFKYILVAAFEFSSDQNGNITPITSIPQNVNRQISGCVGHAKQDYCNSEPIGTAYNPDGSPFIFSGIRLFECNEIDNEWLFNNSNIKKEKTPIAVEQWCAEKDNGILWYLVYKGDFNDYIASGGDSNAIDLGTFSDTSYDGWHYISLCAQTLPNPVNGWEWNLGETPIRGNNGGTDYFPFDFISNGNNPQNCIEQKQIELYKYNDDTIRWVALNETKDGLVTFDVTEYNVYQGSCKVKEFEIFKEETCNNNGQDILPIIRVELRDKITGKIVSKFYEDKFGNVITGVNEVCCSCDQIGCESAQANKVGFGYATLFNGSWILGDRVISGSNWFIEFLEVDGNVLINTQTPIGSVSAPLTLRDDGYGSSYHKIIDLFNASILGSHVNFVTAGNGFAPNYTSYDPMCWGIEFSDAKDVRIVISDYIPTSNHAHFWSIRTNSNPLLCFDFLGDARTAASWSDVDVSGIGAIQYITNIQNI